MCDAKYAYACIIVHTGNWYTLYIILIVRYEISDYLFTALAVTLAEN